MTVPTKVVTHYATDWTDDARFPALRRLGCIDPEPFVEPHPLEEGEHPLMIRCRVTGLCFTVDEARGGHWIPSPEELIERRNAKRDAWTEAERESRDVYLGTTQQERDEAKRCTIPMMSTVEWSRERKSLSAD